MKKIKNCTNILITILLACTILITMLSAFVRFSLTDKDTYLSLLEKTNTYAAVTDALYGKMSAILGSDISEDLKKSIITEEDVRKEADVVIECMISNFISGQAIVPEINTDIYKERIAEALRTLTGYGPYMTNKKDLTSSYISIDYAFEPMNLCVTNYDKVENNILKVNDTQNLSDDLFFENLATRAEIEAKGRAMLRDRGMTEAEARAKLAEKGISESQVWKYLEDNGYLDSNENETIKDTEVSIDSDKINNSMSNSVSDYSDSSTNKKENTQAEYTKKNENDDSRVSREKIQNIVMEIVLDNSTGFQEKMDKVYSELMNLSEIIINKELDSLNLSKIINSNLFNITVKLISILYKSFYINIIILLILTIALASINKSSIVDFVKYLSKAIIISGILSTGIFGYTYLSKFYKSFIVIINKSYFQDIFLSSVEYYFRILLISSIAILMVGLIMNAFSIKKRLTRRKE